MSESGDETKGIGCAVVALVALVLMAIGSIESCINGDKPTVSKPAPEGGVDELNAFIAGQRLVKDRLKAPSTAKFSDYYRGDSGASRVKGTTFRTWGYVDAQNSFGAMLRSQYLAFLNHDGGYWNLDYLLLDDQEYGRIPSLGSPGVKKGPKEGDRFLGMTLDQLSTALGSPHRIITNTNATDGEFKVVSFDDTKGKETLFTIWTADGFASGGQYKGEYLNELTTEQIDQIKRRKTAELNAKAEEKAAAERAMRERELARQREEQMKNLAEAQREEQAWRERRIPELRSIYLSKCKPPLGKRVRFVLKGGGVIEGTISKVTEEGVEVTDGNVQLLAEKRRLADFDRQMCYPVEQVDAAVEAQIEKESKQRRSTQ